MTIFIFLELLVVVVVASAAYLTKIKVEYHKWVKYYCILNAVLGVIAASLALNKVSNILVIYLLIWVELFLLFKYFKEISSYVRKVPNIIGLLSIYLILFFIHFFFEKINSFSPYSLIFEGLVVFCFCISFFIEQVKAPKEPLIFLNPDFWFVSAFILYYGGTWLILASSQYFINDKGLFIYLWDLHNIISILKYLAIGVGFYHIKTL
ncbi:MAG: hypothetical protein IPH93_16465 [Saprospiraceae bacterium]|nr:hypothetical protein [Saprospiraceae bacterium]